MKPARNPEAGYALLLVYAMAAAVAIMLYMELPKVIFEAQRDKEQLLIDRGEQYSRAVQLYVRKYNRFPIDMDALEKTQGIRFLRRKYVDPMTGKDEWRLIHVGPGGQFIDSLVHSKKTDDKNAPQTFITEMQQIGGNAPAAGQGVNLASRTRASDQAGAPGQQGFGTPGVEPPPINGPVMVLPDGRIVPANVSGQAPPNPVAPIQPAGQPGQPIAPGFNGIQTPNGIAFQPGGAGGPPNAASNLINQILTTPRPQPGTGVDQNGNAFGQQQGGPGGVPGQGGNGFGQPGNAPNTGINNTGTAAGQALGGGQVVGGGFAGVASKLEQEGIKSYGQRTAYNEWEFVYDITKDPSRNPQGAAGQNGQNQNRPGVNNPQQSGTRSGPSVPGK